MDRSRRAGAKERGDAPPPASKLTFRAKRNRRKPEAIWARVPRPRMIADACGRAVRRALPAAAALAAIMAIGGTAWAGYRFVTTSSRFAITEISVRGTHHLTVDQARALLPVGIGDNVFATNLDVLVRELRRDPWIAEAEAHRVLPHTIEITIRERTAAALADLGGLYLIDEAGHPFKRAESADGAGLPIVTGLDRTAFLADPEATATQLRTALAALDTWKARSSRPAIGEVHLDPRGALTLHTYEQTTAIQLGALDAELPTRMQTFDAAWNELSDAERARARAIHLDTRPDHVTVAFARN